jgi:hypothetical protein
VGVDFQGVQDAKSKRRFFYVHKISTDTNEQKARKQHPRPPIRAYHELSAFFFLKGPFFICADI